MAGMEIRKTRHQPVEGLTELAAQHNRIWVAAAAKGGDLGPDRCQSVASDLSQSAAFLGQEYSAVPAFEQAQAQLCLELANLAADGGLRQPKLFGGAGETLKPGRSLERAQPRKLDVVCLHD